ncbi:cobyrinic acid a,c-diamide synthase [Methanofervidicoccus sp. A16]|uniref:AAA family ATPase n=1 Tax=Methanofervidicoccus sp. A16 TaxID=2607662 RepID=UPI001189E6F0|nr:AAA family ATPase [Methanofervidicoccus sp. A16]AXI25067.1 cobyrinic acid a,c-diamide synthase [Methanofervidicoccus sp. A16]
MEIGILDIKGSLPCFENFGDLPTLAVNEDNIHTIKDLDMLIIPGGSLIESFSLNERLKKYLLEFDGILFGVCSGFQVLSKRVDIGRKSQYPIFREGLGLLDVEFSPLICTDRVEFKLMDNCIFGKCGDRGEGFHCHTYGDIKLGKGVKVLTRSKVKKLNYRYLKEESYIVSGVYWKNIYGTMVHGFLDNENIKRSLLESLGVDEEEYKAILNKNRDLKEKLKRKSIIYPNRKRHEKEEEENKKRGVILLSTGSQSGKTFLLTSIVSKLDGKTFVAKIGPDVRDIVPSLYILREPMLKYSSIKIGDRGWCDVEEFLRFVEESDYKYYIVEGVMGAFTGALREKNYSSAEVSKLLGFPVYVISSCSKGGIEGAFVEGLSYYSLLKSMGVDVRGIILNRVYDFQIFEKVRKIGEEIGVKVIGVKKGEGGDSRGFIPEVEIDYESFCRSAMGLDFELEIPLIDTDKRMKEGKNFEYYLKKWAHKFLDLDMSL